MKFCLRFISFRLLWISLVVILFLGNLIGQDEEKKTIRSKIEYFQDHNQIGRLVTTLKVKEDRNAPLEGGLVHFYSIGQTAAFLLDSVSTNEEGQAILIFNDTLKIFKDSSGLMNFESVYKENQEYRGATSQMQIQTAVLSLSFFQKDTIKYIAAEAYKIGADDGHIPIDGVEILFNVKGTFSLLTIGEEETDEDGKAILEFPVDMPGDSTGVMTIISKIEDHDLYGNLESNGKINWGKPVPLAKVTHRGLGDTDAPLWMVYTLIVLLSVVWFHYFYIIFGIIKIKLSRTKIPSVQELN